MKSAAKLFLMATILCLGLSVGVRAQDETPPAGGAAADKPAQDAAARQQRKRNQSHTIV